MNKEEIKMFDLTDHQWLFVKSILSLLEAVDQVTTTLSGERYSTLSWCLPLLFDLHEEAKLIRMMFFSLELSESSLSS